MNIVANYSTLSCRVCGFPSECRLEESNLQPIAYKAIALPVELSRRKLREKELNLHCPAYETGYLPLIYPAISVQNPLFCTIRLSLHQLPAQLPDSYRTRVAVTWNAGLRNNRCGVPVYNNPNHCPVCYDTNLPYNGPKTKFLRRCFESLSFGSRKSVYSFFSETQLKLSKEKRAVARKHP